jgi:SAM-dependent methyltransferase
MEKGSMFNHNGYCPICEMAVSFAAKDSWFRDNLFCSGCSSIPRERALMKVISDFYPNWRDLVIHESSPGDRGASTKLRRECKDYTSSHFYPNITLGQINNNSGYRCEDIEKLTFPDNSFDLFITQDVMEHIFDPEKAFKEISRVLKPGGAHIFTVPLINKVKKSVRWASLGEDGEITHHHPAEYHGNPVDLKGALVTMHWGYDIANYIAQTTKMPTVIIMIDNIDLGIRAEYIDVLLSLK